MVNGNDSLISLSDFLYLVYRNARDLYVLILKLIKPATLLNSLISSNDFLVTFLGFSIHSIMSSVKSESFTFFPIWIPFIYISSLNALV